MAGLVSRRGVAPARAPGAGSSAPPCSWPSASSAPLGGTFLAFPEAFAGTLVLVVETALTVSIAATLALLVLGPPRAPRARRRAVSPDLAAHATL